MSFYSLCPDAVLILFNVSYLLNVHSLYLLLVSQHLSLQNADTNIGSIREVFSFFVGGGDVGYGFRCRRNRGCLSWLVGLLCLSWLKRFSCLSRLVGLPCLSLFVGLPRLNRLLHFVDCPLYICLFLSLIPVSAFMSFCSLCPDAVLVLFLSHCIII